MIKKIVIVLAVVVLMVNVVSAIPIVVTDPDGALVTSVDRTNGQSGNRSPIGEFDEDNYLGFRVASEVPEPCSLALLSLGGLSLIKRRRTT